jgi:hypothetical protein
MSNNASMGQIELRKHLDGLRRFWFEFMAEGSQEPFTHGAAEARFLVYDKLRNALLLFLTNHIDLFVTRSVTAAWLTNLVQEALYHAKADGNFIQPHQLEHLAYIQLQHYESLTEEEQIDYMRDHYPYHDLTLIQSEPVQNEVLNLKMMNALRSEGREKI